MLVASLDQVFIEELDVLLVDPLPGQIPGQLVDGLPKPLPVHGRMPEVLQEEGLDVGDTTKRGVGIQDTQQRAFDDPGDEVAVSALLDE